MKKIICHPSDYNEIFLHLRGLDDLKTQIVTSQAIKPGQSIVYEVMPSLLQEPVVPKDLTNRSRISRGG